MSLRRHSIASSMLVMIVLCAASVQTSMAQAPDRQTTEAASRTAKTKVAVMAIQASETIPTELADSLTDLVPQVLDDLGPFKAISSSDIM